MNWKYSYHWNKFKSAFNCSGEKSKIANTNTNTTYDKEFLWHFAQTAIGDDWYKPCNDKSQWHHIAITQRSMPLTKIEALGQRYREEKKSLKCCCNSTRTWYICCSAICLKSIIWEKLKSIEIYLWCYLLMVKAWKFASAAINAYFCTNAYFAFSLGPTPQTFLSLD